MCWTPCSDDASVAATAAEKDILCVLFEEFMEPDEIDINVTVTAVQNQTDHPNQVKGSVETVVHNYCDPTFALHFTMKTQTFQEKDNPLLTSEPVLWSDLIIFIVSIKLIIIADRCCCAMIL